MKKRRIKVGKKIAAFALAAATVFTSADLSTLAGVLESDENVYFIDNGGYRTEVFGVGTSDWGKSWQNRTETLPPATTYLTDNYRETVGTVPTSDWASSVVFDQYSESLYAHPLAYRAASNGMQMAAPAVTDTTSYVDNEPMVESLLNDETVELVVGADGFTAKDARVDKTTDWTYELIMANTAGTSAMRATIAKGTPYAYYTFENLSPTISLGAGATNLAIYKNSTASNILGISLTNKKDNKTHYYGVYAPAGTTWTNAGGKLTAKLPSGANYLSIATLPDNSDAAFALYETYAFNFITDTKVEWEYHPNESKIYTKYSVTTTNMQTNAEGGDTIIAMYPHQWRYADESFTGYTYDTIRGTMKTIVGNSYITAMTYNGILSSLPVTTDETYIGKIKDQLGYLYDYRKNKEDPKWIVSLEGQYGGYDTYWVGKNLNTLTDAIFLAGQFQDDDMKTITSEMVEGVANYLQFWFNPKDGYENGNTVDDYFYYHKDYGTLIGYPASYSSDLEVNDHHFHYGYWIKAAAAVAMNDSEWAGQWGGMVYEMISDIANTNRDGSSYNKKSPAKYPFLRNFDIYEGHSWASGVANYEYDANGNMIDPHGGLSGGNNQESSSESVNAWSSLILWGEAVGDTRIRDLGVYLYTTEVAAIEDYYYDVHEEIFTDSYKSKGNYDIQTVTRLFGGRYDHTAWWTEDPIEVTTITMLPMNGASLYLGKYPNKVKAVVDSIDETSKQWTTYVPNKQQICDRYGKADMLTDPEMHQDILAEFYAFYDADEALARWDSSDDGKVESGESRAHTLAYLTSLKEYGVQDFTVTGSTPLSMVLTKNGVKTYIAQNVTDQDQRVYFTDGAYIDVPANSSYEGAKTGDEDNPNVDDSEILGPQKKYNLEVYKEKLNGDGYDMTSRTVNVKTEENSYTYTPAEITGFTFDSSAANHLTVNVTEGTIETVKVYYKRNSYTVSYELNGGTNAAGNPTQYRYGEAVELKPAEKAGSVFYGWYTDAAFTQQITAISSSIAGNLNLYAHFVDAALITSYKVEYYQQKEDKSGYTLVSEDTQIIENVLVGTSVSADKKDYEGFMFNEGMSTVSGAVLADGALTLKLYYDVKPTYNRSDKGIERGTDGKITLYVTDAKGMNVSVALYKVYDSQAEAKTAVLGSLGGYTMTNTGGVLTYTITEAVSDEKYIAYAFNGGIQETPVVIKVSDIPKTDGSNTGSGETGGGGTGGEEPGGDAQYTGRGMQYKDGKLCFYVADAKEGVAEVKVPYNVYKTKEEAEKRAEQEGDAGIPCCVLKYDTAQKCWLGEVEIAVGDTDYILYTFYFAGGSEAGFGKWNISGKAEAMPADYKVEYYQQNVERNGYDLAAAETKSGAAGSTATAAVKDYPGFTYDADYEGTIASGTVTADGNLVLKLYYTRNQYDIRYILNGGTQDEANPAVYVYGAGVPELRNPVRAGYTFGGWYENASFTGSAVTVIPADRTGDVALYARWTEDGAGDNPGTDTYTGRGVEYKEGKLTFYVADIAADAAGVKCYYKIYASEEEALAADGSGDIENMEQANLAYDSKSGCWSVSVEVELTGENYLLYAFDFEGSTQEESYDWNVVSGSIVSSGQTVIAAYTVEHYWQDVSGQTYTLAASEAKKTIAGAAVKAAPGRYTGFFYNAEAADAKTSGKVAADGSLVLKLYYDRETYAINYNVNGGTQNVSNPSSYLYGAGVAELKDPARTGYTFDGWYEDASFTGEKVTSISNGRTGEVCLYAKWAPATPGGTTPDGTTSGGTAEAVNAKAPEITLQPKAMTIAYKEVSDLTVTAASADGGKISYQWYENTKDSITGAAAINGATMASYTVPSSAIGTTYYYCMVTNENNIATGNKTAVTNSDIVKVQVVKAPNPITKVSGYRKAIGSKLTLKPAGAATYKSSKSKVASVSKKGKITFRRIGKAVITVKAKGNAYYEAATKRITIIVTPKKAVASPVKSTKAKTATVKWKRDSKVTGYMIQYSVSSKFKGAKTVRIKNRGTTSAILKNLKGGTKYYVRVCGYKMVNGKPISGSWSSTRTVKVKK